VREEEKCSGRIFLLDQQANQASLLIIMEVKEACENSKKK
jgi:hypothetical protein